MAAIATIFAPVANVFAAIADVFPAVAAILDPIAHPAVVPGVTAILAAVADVLASVAAILASIADVLGAVAHPVPVRAIAGVSRRGQDGQRREKRGRDEEADEAARSNHGCGLRECRLRTGGIDTRMTGTSAGWLKRSARQPWRGRSAALRHGSRTRST